MAPSPDIRYISASPKIGPRAVEMYVWFRLSLRNVGDQLVELGTDNCHETMQYSWHVVG